MLEVSGLCAGYAGMPVLREVSFRLEAGEMLLIAGENGAGKSTLLRAIAGLIRPTAGHVRVDGVELAGRGPDAIVSAGLRLVLDGHRVFPNLSVRDNLRLGGMARRASTAETTRAMEEAVALFPILGERMDQPARDLSGGQQQMLALGQAVMGRPRVLLCDEPSLGVATALMPAIMGFLSARVRDGAAVALVEQHLAMALPHAHRACLLDRGELVMTGPASGFMAQIEGRARPGVAAHG